MHNPQINLNVDIFEHLPCPNMPDSTEFLLFLLNNRLVLMIKKPSKTLLPQIFNDFDLKWESSQSFFPEKVHFHSTFSINYNSHVLVGRHYIMKTWKPINIFISLSNSVIQTSYTTKSIFSPAFSVIIAKSKNSIFLVNKRFLEQADKHFQMDFDSNSKLSLKRYHVNAHLLNTIQSTTCFCLNESFLMSTSLPCLFSSYSTKNYLKIQRVLKTFRWSKIKMISSNNSQRSIQISLPKPRFQLTENLNELFNFTNSTIITLSNGLIFISGGHQKSSFKAINNCCLLKVSSIHDRKPQDMSLSNKKVPSMLLISKNNLATVENMTSPSNNPEWMEFYKIVDFLLDPSTPVVCIYYLIDY